eukprot:TRINITY_DN7130_c0_g2_i1.p1 TRINITY_DN7130_c0_g2~~TRINITY_DN7130_c0_g2_i1.p1  ORF type:complete len:168 (-),score=38.16 TRINITY_DN7130_c0_g2_i1:42-545(-)
MQDPELRELTASELLSLEEERENQSNFEIDDSKYIFIILDKSRPDTPGTGKNGGGMAGDINFFLCSDDRNVAEISVMIVAKESLRKGLAFEAIKLAVYWAFKELKLNKIIAKIGYSNVPSQKLFSKLHFVEVNRSDFFSEITYSLVVDSQIVEELEKDTSGCTISLF